MSRPDDALVALGRTIRELREEQQLSRRTLAQRAGMTPRRLRAIENARHDPTFDVIFALARPLHIRPHDLIDRAEELTPDPIPPQPNDGA